MKILLFLGSGVSIPSGLPDTEKITDAVLNEEWHSTSSLIFLPGPEPNPIFREENWVLRIQPFLRILKSHADKYLISRKRPGANYEDLYYMARQINDEELGEIYNPIIGDFASKIRTEIRHLCNPIPMTREEVTLEDLSERACVLIECVVWHKLFTEGSPIGMDLVKELALSDAVDRLDIVTTNHDILVEKSLEAAHVPYADGFGHANGDVRFFDASSFDGADTVRLFKLHGSINWHRFREQKDNHSIHRYGIPLNRNSDHCRDSKGNLLLNLAGKPQFLAGTYNKMLDYGTGIFAEMHYMFHQILKEHSLMVMSGYGWNDRGVNFRLMEWLHSSLDKKLYLLHEDPETQIRDQSRSGMWHRYDNLVKEGQLIPRKKWLQDMNLDELLKIINMNCAPDN